MSERLLSAEDLGALAPYDNGSYVCECPGDHCLAGDCLGKLETLSTVVEGIVRREVAKALEGAREDIRQRRRTFVGLHADPQYINALDDAFGLVNNRLRDAESGGQS